MKVTEEKLNKIFEKTRGKCHLCHKQLAFKNYGVIGNHGAWEIEHSKPKSKGGTDHLNNLFPACIRCNREKGNGTN
ncbi:MAG: HNH endonuclease [Candidatus Thiodiazotropha sp. LLP2]